MKKSQLRQDLVSGDWIVISPGRAKKPHFLPIKILKKKTIPKSTCPFENPQKAGNKQPILIYPHTKRELASGTQEKNNFRYGVGVCGNCKKWELQVVENKYPVFIDSEKQPVIFKKGPFTVTDAVGRHDLVITRDHNKNFAGLSNNEARQVFEAFRDRYLMFLNDPRINYVSIFHNWGPLAGASIYHPHYQIIAMPVVPPDIMHSLDGSKRYFKNHKKCVHCAMIDWEKKQKKRILYENDGAIAFAPFVSKNPFEIRVFPKKHLSYFENTLDVDMDYMVAALRFSLKKIEKNLKDPDYNFFIHTAPIKDKQSYGMYHWHMEIIPKMDIYAGFELGTGVEINVADPDDAVKLLRK